MEERRLNAGSPDHLAQILLEQIKLVIITRAELCGDVMKTRCDHCCGAFGLVRRRYFGYQFCCEACEGAYKEERAKIVAQFKCGTRQAVTNPTGADLTNNLDAAVETSS